MYNNKNICCIWYPSGAFGHFINAVLTQYCDDFVGSKTAKYDFSATGDSHSNPLVAPKFLFNPVDYEFDFAETNKQYSVLVDNGIGDESDTFVNTFPQATVIKVCYSTTTWPIVASAAIHKAMGSDLESELGVDHRWPDSSRWAQREKYFLFLTDHHYRTMWKPQSGYHNLLVDSLLEYQDFRQQLESFGFVLRDFSQLWTEWHSYNRQYIKPVLLAQQVIAAVQQRRSWDLSQYQDLWTQAVVNYLIWDTFGYTVPANDFADWFTNTDQITALLAQHHVST